MVIKKEVESIMMVQGSNWVLFPSVRIEEKESAYAIRKLEEVLRFGRGGDGWSKKTQRRIRLRHKATTTTN